MNLTIVIPVHNQSHYTRQCLASLNAAGITDEQIVVINNASADDTAEFLAARPTLRVINNPENRACAAAWNQGFQASTTDWTLFLNNDVVVPRDCLQNLLAFAATDRASIVSPALGEGELDYDLETYAAEFMREMRAARRPEIDSGVCFAVHRRVFTTIGGFDENFRKGGSEDKDFFWRARAAGFTLATTGSAYLHHFGSITQRALEKVRGSSRPENAGYLRAKWKLNWARRRWRRLRRRWTQRWWSWNERRRYGHSLREVRFGGKIFHH